MDFQGFRTIVSQLFKMKLSSVLDQSISKRIFNLFDIEKKNTLNFTAFMNGLSSLFYGTISERAGRFFSILDLDDSGDISISELESILSIRGQVGLFDEKLQKLMVSLDVNHDGAISKRGKQTKIFIHIQIFIYFIYLIEFTTSVIKTPSILKNFEDFLFLGIPFYQEEKKQVTIMTISTKTYFSGRFKACPQRYLEKVENDFLNHFKWETKRAGYSHGHS